SQTLEGQIGRSLAELAEQCTRRLDDGLAERYREIRLLSLRRDLFDAAAPAATQQLLEQLQNGYKNYAWIGVTDLNGRVLAATQGILTGVDVSKRPWWSNALNGKNLGDVHDAKLLAAKLPYQDGEPWRFVDVAFTYKNQAGIDAGVVGAHLSWSWAREVQKSIFASADADMHIESLVLSDTNTVLLGPKDLLGKSLQLRSVRAAGGKKSGYLVETWPDGASYLVGYSQVRGFDQIEGMGWKILLRQRLDEAYRPVRQMQLHAALIGSAVAVLFALSSWLLARRITRPLSQLAEAAKRIRFDHSEPLQSGPRTYREVGEMSDAFASLIENLQSKESELRKLNATLESRVAERTAALEQSEMRLRTIADNMPVLIGYINAQMEYEFCNATYQIWFKRPVTEILQRKVADVVSPATYASIAPYLQAALAGKRMTFEAEQVAGPDTRYLRSTYLPERDRRGAVVGVYILVIDITEQKRAERTLEHNACHDVLTGLPNRTVLMSHLDKTLALSARHLGTCAVMFLDIDRFKSINDSYGHEVGDKVLVEFSQRVRAVMREADLLARLGGDEFVVVATELPSGPAGAINFAQRIIDQFRSPLVVEGVSYDVRTSIGIAINDGMNESKEVWLRRADQALYSAKAAGRNTIHMAVDLVT
ncbi:MAG: diguanylate cyclase, partial [Pseudomonadota bacterium]|nr:diguanylate cyclase [Pseudomonadota bacterium]